MLPSFVPDKARPLAPREWLIPSIFAVCLAGTVFPPGKVNTLITGAVSLYLAAQIPKATTGLIPQDYMLPIQSLLFITQWLDFCVLHSPAEATRDQDKEKVPKTWWEKLKWSWDLNSTYRGIGWNWRVKNVRDAPAGMSKWTFVRTETVKACAWYLLFDVCFQPLFSSPYHVPNPPNVLSDTWYRQAFYGLMIGIGNYCSLNIQFSLAAAMSVALGLYKPADWPPGMGKLREVSTVRDFWGKFWHQNLRRKLTMPFNLITRYITIPKGTLLSRYTQLYLAFIATTLIHHSGAMNLPSSTSASNLNQVAFFMLQPVAITIGDLVIYLGRKAGVKESRLTRGLGSLWTFAWFAFSLRYALAFFAHSGILADDVMPSLIQAVLRLMKNNAGESPLKEL